MRFRHSFVSVCLLGWAAAVIAHPTNATDPTIPSVPTTPLGTVRNDRVESSPGGNDGKSVPADSPAGASTSPGKYEGSNCVHEDIDCVDSSVSNDSFQPVESGDTGTTSETSSMDNDSNEAHSHDKYQGGSPNYKSGYSDSEDGNGSNESESEGESRANGTSLASSSGGSYGEADDLDHGSEESDGEGRYTGSGEEDRSKYGSGGGGSFDQPPTAFDRNQSDPSNYGAGGYDSKGETSSEEYESGSNEELENYQLDEAYTQESEVDDETSTVTTGSYGTSSSDQGDVHHAEGGSHYSSTGSYGGGGPPPRAPSSGSRGRGWWGWMPYHDCYGRGYRWGGDTSGYRGGQSGSGWKHGSSSGSRASSASNGSYWGTWTSGGQANSRHSTGTYTKNVTETHKDKVLDTFQEKISETIEKASNYSSGTNVEVDMAYQGQSAPDLNHHVPPAITTSDNPTPSTDPTVSCTTDNPTPTPVDNDSPWGPSGSVPHGQSEDREGERGEGH